MKIRLLKDIAGSSVKGAIFDIDKYVAEMMIAKGEAEAIKEETPKKRGRKKKEE